MQKIVTNFTFVAQWIRDELVADVVEKFAKIFVEGALNFFPKINSSNYPETKCRLFWNLINVVIWIQRAKRL